MASNWGNWAYIAGVGPDPRGGRIFNLNDQADRYDPDKLIGGVGYNDPTNHSLVQTRRVVDHEPLDQAVREGRYSLCMLSNPIIGQRNTSVLSGPSSNSRYLWTKN